jgi:hypothetical protein
MRMEISSADERIDGAGVVKTFLKAGCGFRNT